MPPYPLVRLPVTVPAPAGPPEVPPVTSLLGFGLKSNKRLVAPARFQQSLARTPIAVHRGDAASTDAPVLFDNDAFGPDSQTVHLLTG